MIVLLDQDGVLADFERGFVEAWRRRHSDLPWIEAEARRRFHLTEDYPGRARREALGRRRADPCDDPKPPSGKRCANGSCCQQNARRGGPMQARDFTDVTLPPQAVANSEFPYERQVARARRFLAARGITEVRPLYGAKFPRTDVAASAGPPSNSSPAPARAAGERAQARWFDARCA